jgi:hypothetical protein
MGESDMTILNQTRNYSARTGRLSQPGPLNPEPGKMRMEYGDTVVLCSPMNLY